VAGILHAGVLYYHHSGADAQGQKARPENAIAKFCDSS
jgi:hypothetical protein